MSLVPVPADRDARISIAASVGDRIGFEKFLHSAGFARAAAAKLARGGWPALAGADDRIETLAERVRNATAKLKGKA